MKDQTSGPPVALGPEQRKAIVKALARALVADFRKYPTAEAAAAAATTEKKPKE
jgi:hypothetical protein